VTAAPRFLQLLGATREWCDARATAEDPAGSTRRAEVAIPELWGPGTGGERRIRYAEHLEAALRQLQKLRGAANAQPCPDSVDSLSGGRLLTYRPESSLGGPPTDASGGFLGVANAPGWDTWIDVVTAPRRRLASYKGVAAIIICYVPACLVSVADEGLLEIVDDSLRWVPRDVRPSRAYVDALREVRAISLIEYARSWMA
jgi:hypothetical protein